MYTIILLSIFSNAFFIWLLFYSHKKGGRCILGCGLFFLAVTLSVLTAMFIRTYYGSLPLGMSEGAFNEFNEKLEWVLAIFGFVPAVFTGNMISKGLDILYPRK